jgi:hypothetical protein
MLRRLLAVASAASLVTVLGVAVSTADAAAATPHGHSFTSQAATLSIVTNFARTPAGKGTSQPGGVTAGGAANAGDSASDGGKPGLSTLSPKGDRGRNANHASGGVQAGGAASESQTSSRTPATSSSFAGQVSSATTCHYFLVGCNPPDMALAAGPSFALQGVNTQWAVYDTSGHIQPGWPVSAQNFFGVPNTTLADGTPCDTEHLSQPFLSDPRALYDPVDGRYWAAMLQVENALGIASPSSNPPSPDPCQFTSVFWVAVSQTGNPNGKWNVYEFNTSIDGQFANDYTQIGVNGQGFYVSANMFGPGTGLNGGFYAELFEANKAQMEHGTAHFTPDAFYDLLGFGPGTRKFGSPFVADTVQPTLNLDSSAGAAETFVDTIDGPDLNNGHLCGFAGGGMNQACSGLIVWRMSNPIAHDTGGPAPTLTGSYVGTNPFLLAPPQTQPSCAQCVDSLDIRITGTPVIRNGVLYATWDTAIQNDTQIVPGIEWAEVKLDGGQATSNYYNFQGDGSATFGTVMPDARGNVTMVFDHMSSTTFPEIRYITKAAGAAKFSGLGVLLKAGEASYRPELCGTSALPVCRWGDFEATSFDGAGHIWFASQYANLYAGLTTPPQYGRNWSTWIGAINAS